MGRRPILLRVKIMRINLNNNFWQRVKKNKGPIAFIAGLVIVLFLLRGGCQPESNYGENAIIKNETLTKAIEEGEVKKDSVRTVIEYRDRIREKIVYKYKTIRHDSLLPCEEKLILCDTLLYVDSTLIQSLKAEITLSDTIISKQGQLILSQENDIKDLTKDLKKEKRKKRFWQIMTAAAGAIAITNR